MKKYHELEGRKNDLSAALFKVIYVVRYNILYCVFKIKWHVVIYKVMVI